MASSDNQFKATAELPPLPSAPREYKVPGVLMWACMVSLAHLGPFFGIFFSSLGSDSIAWWSFCFFGSAISHFFFYLEDTTATLVRNENNFEFKNLHGEVIGEAGALDLYEGVESLNPQRTKFAIVRTDAHVENMKSEHKYCAGCIGKKITLSFTSADNAKFAEDHGLASGQDAVQGA